VILVRRRSIPGVWSRFAKRVITPKAPVVEWWKPW